MMRLKMAKMRLKMAKMRLKMAKKWLKMTKMRPKTSPKWFGSISPGRPPRPASTHACILVLFSCFFTVKTKTSDTHWPLQFWILGP